MKTASRIQEAGSQIGETSAKIDKSLMMSSEALTKSKGAAEEARDKPGNIVDKDTAYIFRVMSNHSNPQLE